MASLTTPQFICYTEYVVGSGHPGGLPDVSNRAPTTIWSNQQAVNTAVEDVEAEIAEARESGTNKPAADLLEALAQRLDDRINNAAQSGGTLINQTGTAIDVAPLTAYIDGYYQETTSTTTVTGMTAGTRNYVYATRGTGLSPVFGTDTTKATPSAVYLGEVDLGGSTSVTYAAKGRYSTDWTSINTTTAKSVTVNHRLGFVPEPHQVHVLFTDDTDPAVGKTFLPNRQAGTPNAAGIWITSITSLACVLQVGADGVGHATSAGVTESFLSGWVRLYARRESSDV
ncbi:MAG: hypothetical protein KC466_03120 [Myxococcales bacterium]|nr:hypothetical protein [Myxococcales bacterium]